MKAKDGHKLHIVVEDGTCSPRIECPFKGKTNVESVTCTKDFCALQEEVATIGWEVFYESKAFEILKAPIELQWWITGSYEESELWIEPASYDTDVKELTYE